MTAADRWLAVGILLVALLSAGGSWYRLRATPAAGKHAHLKAGGETAARVPLAAEPGRYKVDGRLGPSTIEVEGGKVRIVEAPCPGQICVKQGWISAPGESIACVPGEILIRVEGASALDAVTR